MKIILPLMILTSTVFCSESGPKLLRDNRGVRFGLKAGLNSTRSHEQETSATMTLTKVSNDQGGMSAGGLVEIPMGSTIYLQGEVAFASFSWPDEVIINNVPTLATGSYRAIETQLLLKYLAHPEEPNSLFVLIGAAPVFRMSTKYHYPTNQTIPEEDKKDSFKGFMVSAVLGAGWRFSIGEETDLALDVRYLTGFTNLRDNEFRLGSIYLGASLFF